jgi:hypothetical protein
LPIAAIYRGGVDLIFDYYLMQNNERARKLAHGTHKMAWVGRDSHNEPIVMDVPKNVVTAISEELHQRR